MLVTVETDVGTELAARVASVHRQTQANVERLRRAMEQLDATREQLRTGRVTRTLLHQSAYARLSAKMETLPVIEQAKGVIMAQTGCGPDEAFGILCAMSQRSNVKVRELAADVVSRAGGAPSPNGGGRRTGAAGAR